MGPVRLSRRHCPDVCSTALFRERRQSESHGVFEPVFLVRRSDGSSRPWQPGGLRRLVRHLRNGVLHCVGRVLSRQRSPWTHPLRRIHSRDDACLSRTHASLHRLRGSVLDRVQLIPLLHPQPRSQSPPLDTTSHLFLASYPSSVRRMAHQALATERRTVQLVQPRRVEPRNGVAAGRRRERAGRGT